MKKKLKIVLGLSALALASCGQGPNPDVSSSSSSSQTSSSQQSTPTSEKSEVYPSSVTMSETFLTLVKGQTKTLTASILPAESTVRTLTWTSSDQEVATVDQNGKITAIGTGAATIKAEAVGGAAAEIVISVTESLEGFPDVSTFATKDAYAPAAPSKWSYNAKVDGKKLFIQLQQNIAEIICGKVGEEDKTKDTHVRVEISDDNLGGTFVLTAFPTGRVILPGSVKAKAKCSVKATSKSATYFITLDAEDDLSIATRAKFFSADPKYGNKKYVFNEVTGIVDGVFYHTHAGQGWYISKSISFKPESLFLIKDNAGIPSPEQWGIAASPVDEGCYIYAYQNTNYVSDSDIWNKVPHLELSVYQHNIGMGAQYGFDVDTYMAFFPGVSENQHYINNNTNILGKDVEVTVKEGRIEYRIFLRFENNLENPADGPYMMFKGRSVVPSDQDPYSGEDVIEYRDTRFAHTTIGSSLFFSKGQFAWINNEFEGAYLEDRMNSFKKAGLQGQEDLTLFIGDSYFEPDYSWWTNFYQDFAGKVVGSSAIGGTKITQWRNYQPTLIHSFDEHLKNLVIHLGYNDVNGSDATAQQIERYIEEFVEKLNVIYPDVDIYYLGCGVSSWFDSASTSSNPHERSLKPRATELDVLTKAYCETNEKVAFVDMNQAVADYIAETGGSKDSFYKDGTHPKNENYKYIVNLIEAAGCEFADKK